MDGVILARLRGPEDLAGLGVDELNRLAGEIRQEIVDTVARTGGHLAPSLGVVELTLALHKVFQSPRDKIIWDTGHQTYAHKLLTGRWERFGTLRQPGGLSGFCKRRESPHDLWEAGHAGTALSAALGFARARDRRGEDHHVVAVVGDGALTAGMSFEALNNAGHEKTRIIVVLNDNSMSIAPNVGAISSYLSRLRVGPAYTRFKDDLERWLGQIPRIGQGLARTAERFKDSLKHVLLPGMLFEDLGFTYLGPVDGHHLPSLLSILRDATRLNEPVLIHVVTRKGKGYGPAEARPDAYHGTGPFDVATGRPLQRPGPPTYTEVFGRTLAQMAANRPEVVAITAAMPDGTGLQEFARACPDRCFDVGIAEPHAVTFAAGLAAAGLRPVVAIYSTFLQRAYDQVLHDVGIQRLPVVFALDRAGLVGADGETHQGLYDIAFLRHIPGMAILAPKDENEMQHALATALACEDGPVAVRYPRGAGRGVALDAAPRPLPWGRSQVLREGGDVAILAAGPLAYAALEAAEILAGEGVDAAVVNARFLKPLDGELITDLARRTGAVLTVEEHTVRGGFGSAVLELLSERGLWGVRTRVMGLPDAFVEQGDPAEQLAACGLDAAGIAAAARDLLRGVAAPSMPAALEERAAARGQGKVVAAPTSGTAGGPAAGEAAAVREPWPAGAGLRWPARQGGQR